MKPQLTNTARVIGMAMLFASCQKDPGHNFSQEKDLSVNSISSANENNGKSAPGHVYTLSNSASGNYVLDYLRSAQGKLSFSAAYPTGGNGSGGGLGNQGAVILSSENQVLLAVNAGSNSVSSFTINDRLEFKSTVSSGGVRPVSIAQHKNLVYVLNAGGVNNISGFKLSNTGVLQPIPNSTKPLSAASTGPAQVSFVNGGKVLVITEKATNQISTYTVDEQGLPGAMQHITSSTATPFGFAIGRQGNIFVSEAQGGAAGASVLSSYNIGNNGSITLVKGSVGAGQSAACWVVITNNGKYAFATNTASDNISTFGISNSGDVNVTHAISATTMAGPIDAALSNNSKFFYVLNGGGQSIQAFSVNNDGTLSFLQTISAMPASTNGLAAN